MQRDFIVTPETLDQDLQLIHHYLVGTAFTSGNVADLICQAIVNYVESEEIKRETVKIEYYTDKGLRNSPNFVFLLARNRLPMIQGNVNRDIAKKIAKLVTDTCVRVSVSKRRIFVLDENSPDTDIRVLFKSDAFEQVVFEAHDVMDEGRHLGNIG